MKASADNNYHYKKEIQPLAKKLRQSMTKAEACLWKYVLRAGMLKGYKFRRQRALLNYIADFMCKELMLIIEVDGITHSHDEQVQRDIERQKILEQAGFTVLRFEDEDVLQHINQVRDALIDWIEKFEKKKTR